MTARVFDNRLSQQWIGFTILHRLIIGAIIVHFSLAAMSGYRAIVQVYGVEIETNGPVLSAGSRITARVSASGRNPVTARLELVQGLNVVTIGTGTVPANGIPFYDPRPQRAAFHTTLQPELADAFKPGSATLRLTALGRSQWLRVPPPKVQELAIQLK